MNQEERDYRRQVATIILQQMGGKAFVKMTGAHDFIVLTESHPGLRFSLPRKRDYVKEGINRVVIQLMPSDTYDVSFQRKTGDVVETIVHRECVYCDELQDLFEECTGLDTQSFRVVFG